MTISNILVPIDHSPYAEHALDYAVELAAKLGAKVNVVTVVGVPIYGGPELGMALPAATLDALISDNQRALDELAKKRSLNGKALVRTGDARDVILQTVEELGADLIVMGTHGRRGISRALLGSVAETVVRASPVPVLTVRGKKS